MKFGNTFFPLSITILESDNMEFLLGLDMLKRHRCQLDMSKGCLRIDGANGPEEVNFLGEADLPQSSLFQKSPREQLSPSDLPQPPSSGEDGGGEKMSS